MSKKKLVDGSEPKRSLGTQVSHELARRFKLACLANNEKQTDVIERLIQIYVVQTSDNIRKLADSNPGKF